MPKQRNITHKINEFMSNPTWYRMSPTGQRFLHFVSTARNQRIGWSRAVKMRGSEIAAKAFLTNLFAQGFMFSVIKVPVKIRSSIRESLEKRGIPLNNEQARFLLPPARQKSEKQPEFLLSETRPQEIRYERTKPVSEIVKQRELQLLTQIVFREVANLRPDEREVPLHAKAIGLQRTLNESGITDPKERLARARKIVERRNRPKKF